MFPVLIGIMGCIISVTISARVIEPPPVLDPSLIKKLERRVDHKSREKSRLKEFPSEDLSANFGSEEEEFGGSQDQLTQFNEKSPIREDKNTPNHNYYPNKKLLSKNLKNSDQTFVPTPKTEIFNEPENSNGPSRVRQLSLMKNPRIGPSLGARPTINNNLSTNNPSNGFNAGAPLVIGSSTQKKMPQVGLNHKQSDTLSNAESFVDQSSQKGDGVSVSKKQNTANETATAAALVPPDNMEISIKNSPDNSAETVMEKSIERGLEKDIENALGTSTDTGVQSEFFRANDNVNGKQRNLNSINSSNQNEWDFGRVNSKISEARVIPTKNSQYEIAMAQDSQFPGAQIQRQRLQFPNEKPVGASLENASVRDETGEEHFVEAYRKIDDIQRDFNHPKERRVELAQASQYSETSRESEKDVSSQSPQPEKSPVGLEDENSASMRGTKEKSEIKSVDGDVKQGSLVFETAKVGEQNPLGVVVTDQPNDPGEKIKKWMKKAGEFYQTFEEWMGWDETSRIQKLDQKCKEADAGACFNLALTKHREGKLFEAETWYQISCTLKHQLSCERYKKLVSKRESYEARLLEESPEVAAACEAGIGSSCATAAYIASYFGQSGKSDALNQKACSLGYPAGCMQLARKEQQKGNFEAAKELDEKAKSLLKSH